VAMGVLITNVQTFLYGPQAYRVVCF
jgi:hypothetical protein